MAKLRVAVLFGGTSSEHDISCISAGAIIDNMDTDKYEILQVGITKKGRWLLFPGPTRDIRDGSWHKSPDCVPAFITPDRTNHGIAANHDGKLDIIKLDAVFPVLHGKDGEDGTVQGLLELAGIPYVGAGVLSSAVCMDKAFANLVFDACGLPHTPWMAVDRSEMDDFDSLLARAQEKMAFPLFVKPAEAGSSIGVYKVDEPEDLRSCMQLASAHGRKLILEQAVVGQEVECAVIGNRDLYSTLPGEIISCNEIYDFEAKYESGDDSKLYIPAHLQKEKLEEVRALALRAYAALACEGMARVDFFVQQGTGKVLLSEINTIPGFTSISMYPKLMEHEGTSFSALVDRLVDLAMERAEE